MARTDLGPISVESIQLKWHEGTGAGENHASGALFISGGKLNFVATGGIEVVTSA